MEGKNVAYDSEEDEDFKPEGEESDPEVKEGEEEESGGKRKKGEVNSSRSSKRGKVSHESEFIGRRAKREVDQVPLESEKPKEQSGERKSRIDSLWEMMNQGSTPKPSSSKTETSTNNSIGTKSESQGKVEPPKSNTVSSPSTTPQTVIPPPSTSIFNKPASNAEEKITVTEQYDFAGEKISVTKQVSASQVKPKKSLDSLVSGLKSKKMSTMHKSQLDWEKFKKEEGIEDDLKLKAKGGYLEKQAFLQRADFREFEKEREVRLARRKPTPGKNI